MLNKTLIEQFADNYNLYFGSSQENKDYLLSYEDDQKYGLIVTYNDEEHNIPLNGTQGNTTLLYSKLVSNYFKENYIPYIKVSTYVKNKIVATKGE